MGFYGLLDKTQNEDKGQLGSRHQKKSKTKEKIFKKKVNSPNTT